MSTRAIAASVSTHRLRVSGLLVWALAVWAAAALYATVLSIESVHYHDSYASRGAFDNAIYDQLLWLLAHGHEPFSTVVSRPMLGDHFQPGLVLLTPLYWLGLGVPGLLTAQSIGLALTAPALFTLARVSGASPRVASVPALLWLVSPWVASINLFAFRPSTFAAPLLVLSVLAAKQGRHLLLAITTVLALSTKEDIALTYVALGALLVLLGKRRLGGILALGAVAWFLISSRIMESLAGSLTAFGERFAGNRGNSAGDVVVWMVEHPLDAFTDLAGDSFVGLVLLFVSTAGLAILAPSWILLSAPNALHNALSAYEPQHDLVYHYHLLTLTGLFVAAAIGAGRLPTVGRRTRLAFAGLVPIVALSAVVGGAWVRADMRPGLDLDRVATEQALERIPADVAVASPPRLLPHLTQRREVYTLPEPFVPLDWGSPLTPEEMADRALRIRFVAYLEDYQQNYYKADIADLREILLGEGFAVVARSGPVEILERR